MEFQGFEGYTEAIRAIEKNTSPRAKFLSNLDAWAHGRQYIGRPDWFSGQEVPLWERAPCLVYLLTKAAVRSHTSLVIGQRRFPLVTSSPGEDDEAFDEDLGLNPDDSELMDRFIRGCMKQARFPTAGREALHSAQEVGSAVLIFGARNGKLFCDTTKAQWCEPTLDNEGKTLKLVIQYPYIEAYQDPQMKWKVRTRMYRREIDEQTDVTMLPAEAHADGRLIQWSPDPAQTFTHGFGFCPAIWYAFRRGACAAGSVDGHAIHELLLDEIQALDFAWSQRHRAVLFAGDPQWTEIGVDPGWNPSAGGRPLVMPATSDGGKPSESNPQRGGWVDGGAVAAGNVRKKTPGGVWQYPSKDTKVQLHTLPGNALKALSDHEHDLREKIGEALAYTFLDPDSVKRANQLSGKAMEAFRERELDFCDEIRDDYGDRCLIPSVVMMLRIAAHFVTKAQGLRLPGLKKVASILERFVEDEPSLLIAWPAYAKAEAAEEVQIVTTVSTALKGEYITERMALEKVAAIFNVSDVDQALIELQNDKAARDAREIGKMQAGAKAAGKAKAASNPEGGAVSDKKFDTTHIPHVPGTEKAEPPGD